MKNTPTSCNIPTPLSRDLFARVSRSVCITLVIGLMGISSYSWALSCFFTVAKADCWRDYEVTIKIKDIMADKQVVNAVIPKGKQWARVSYECTLGQRLSYTASFSPVIWQGQDKSEYRGKQFLGLPQEIKMDTTALNIPLCFPKDFAEVPFPPEATSLCDKCNFTEIPKVPSQQINLD